MSDERGISILSVEGFKSIKTDTLLVVKPMTILSGANSTGKSSITQPILLLKQTLEASYDPGTFLLNGPNVKYTAINQFVNERIELTNDENANKRYGFKFSLYVDPIGLLVIIYTTLENFLDQNAIIPSRMLYVRDEDNVIDLSLLQTHEEIIEALGEEVDNLRKITQEVSEDKLYWKVIRDRGFLSLELQNSNDETIVNFGDLSLKNLPINIFKNTLRQLIHVPGIRGNPKRIYNTASVLDNEFSGTFDNYVASLITHWIQNAPEKIEQLIKGLRSLGLTSFIHTSALNDAQIELSVGRTMQSDADDLVNIADVGFGVSQVLPVLVAMLVAEVGQMVYIEQPELHLHPRAQIALASILAEAANRGVRLVIETHSSLLLTGIQTLIAEDKLPADKVMLHWFTRNDEGVTSIQSVQPDENGAYGDWPEDFDEVQLSADSAYLDAVEKRAVEY